MNQPPSSTSAPITVVHVTTIAGSLWFLRGQAAFMRERGIALQAIASPDPFLDEFSRREDVPVHAVEMQRAITPVQDTVALLQLWRALREIRPDIVHSHTPKGGLLGMIAATLAGVPGRIYHVRGLPQVSASGLRRRLLVLAERTSCLLAQRVIAVSHSVRDILVADGLCPPDKVKVLVNGSGQGVDAERRYRPQPAEVRAATRQRLGIPEDALVVGFVGRLVVDKGLGELAHAWERLRQDPRVHLVLVGTTEGEADAIPPDLMAMLRGDERVHFTGDDPNTPPLYAAMDVVALPTYREGFSNVALETAAMGLPIVASRVPGCVDAVIDGRTGSLVAPRDPTALAVALQRYLSDPGLRERHGRAARARVLAEFRPEQIWSAIAQEYRAVAKRAGIADGAPDAREGEGHAFP